MTGTDHRQLQELIPAFVLGALEGEELRRLEEHLNQGCPECEEVRIAFDGTLEGVAESVDPVVPSEVTRARVLRAVGQAPSRPQPSRRPLWLVTAAVAATLAVAAGILLGRHQLRLQGRLDEALAQQARITDELTLLRAQLESVNTEYDRLAARVQELSSPDTRRVQLASLEEDSPATGATLLRPGAERAVFYAYDLPPLPAEKTYQLWYIAADGPVSAGTFDVTEEGYGRVEITGQDLPPDIQLWAVTVEPAGGVPQPTGTMVLRS